MSRRKYLTWENVALSLTISHTLSLSYQHPHTHTTTTHRYMNKARVLKHQNKLEDAADVMDQARTLDLQDRFVNCKAVKYFLRANKPKRAKEVATLFLVDEKGEIKRTMEDMQTYWFETEAGESYMRLGKYGKALKYFCTALSHFEDIKNDQFDFHQYCMRKVTMRAWVRMLRLADNGLKSHKFNLRASFGAIQCYIKLSEMKDIEKKEMFERDREVDEKKKKKKNKEDENGKVDEDPHGEKLASVKSPLDEAWNNVMMMNKFAPLDVRTNIAAFEVSIRQKRFLVALRSLSRMSQDEVSKRKDTFLGALQSAKFDNATVKSVVDQEVKRIFS
jgi:N-alpha-acetyltransferase 15/16, NatA auxiliary subunit